MRNEDDQCVGRTSTGVDGKRIRKPTHKAKALQEDAQAKVRLLDSVLHSSFSHIITITIAKHVQVV